MSFAHKTKEKSQFNALTGLLNQLLADAIDVKLSAKQAHWNVKGENFLSLHELFDKVSGEVEAYADMLAERVVQLGSSAQGTLQTVAGQSNLSAYPVDIHDGQEHLRALSASLTVLADASRQGINEATEGGDLVTADLLTEVTRGLDKLNWFVRSHFN